MKLNIVVLTLLLTLPVKADVIFMQAGTGKTEVTSKNLGNQHIAVTQSTARAGFMHRMRHVSLGLALGITSHSGSKGQIDNIDRFKFYTYDLRLRIGNNLTENIYLGAFGQTSLGYGAGYKPDQIDQLDYVPSIGANIEATIPVDNFQMGFSLESFANTSFERNVGLGVTALLHISHPIGASSSNSRSAEATKRVANKNLVKIQKKWITLTYYFSSNSASLDTRSSLALARLADLLKDNNSSWKYLIVDGHANAFGSQRHNANLSHDRIKSIQMVLNSRNISSKKIINRAHGESRPKAYIDAYSPAQRRVTISVVHTDLLDSKFIRLIRSSQNISEPRLQKEGPPSMNNPS